jgi:hypothetical protein
MRMIMLVMTMPLMTFLSSCRDQIICSQIKSAEIKPIELCDISFKFNRCRCRCFNVNSWETLPMNKCSGTGQDLPDTIDFPIESCDGVAGFYVNDMAVEIRPKIKELNTIKGDYCK